LPAAIPLPRAAALAGLSLLLGWALGAGGSPEMALTGDDGRPAPSHAASSGPAGDAAIFVRFDVRVPEAESVDLAGSFSDWEPRYSLVPAGDGRWSAVVPLTAGVHDYVFIVDGERHLLDPAAPRAPDGFGSYNSRLALLTSGE
ncbi:MAG TPA: glycogen-binding domain-containing protein, partial [Longimicrobiales bacterium]|nr:glycogen-binding domain-containing protein [Longimicrobiales bacterium]